jgi:hypothetical protein
MRKILRIAWNKGLKGEEYRNHYKNGFSTFMLNRPVSQETRLKIGLSSIGRTWKEERRNKIILKLKGKLHSKQHKEKIGFTMKGKFSDDLHPLWKGGLRSYYQKQARNIIEEHIGRKLESQEEVHHLDFNWKNNDITNLYLFNDASSHISYHHFLRKIVNQELEVNL